MASTPNIAAVAVGKLIANARDAGVDALPLLAEVGLDARTVDDRDARVPIEKLYDLWTVLFSVLPRTSALLVAKHYAPGDYGLVGFVTMNSATLGEALGHMVRYVGLWMDDPAMLLDGKVLSVVYRTRFA